MTSKIQNEKNIFSDNLNNMTKYISKPITSYGIIAYKIVYSEEDEINDTSNVLKNILKKCNYVPPHCRVNRMYPKVKLLMIQRKNTIGYTDFIRGKYTNEKMLITCLNEMTNAEKYNIRNIPFDKQWDDLWVNKKSRIYKHEYERAKKRYDKLDINNLLKQSKNSYRFQEFCFPKGRPAKKETQLKCAIREFYEETTYTQDCYDIIDTENPIIEEFTGSDNVRYKHVYYLANMKRNVHSPYIDYTNVYQKSEVREIGWFDCEECISLLRSYDITKKMIVYKLYNILMKDLFVHNRSCSVTNQSIERNNNFIHYLYKANSV